MARLGIYGGTFDPPHLGHLILAEEAVFQLNLDKLLWVLTPNPPHKLNKQLTPLTYRAEMLNVAIADNLNFSFSSVDIERPGPHYAYETLEILSRQYPGNEWFYIMGADSLRDLPTWKKPHLLVKCVNKVCVLSRQGITYDFEYIDRKVPGLLPKLRVIKSPIIDISSSDIRDRVARGFPIRYFITTGVYNIILKENLYQPKTQEILLPKAHS